MLCCAKNAGVCPAGLPQELFLDSQTPPYSALQTLLVVLRQDMMRSTNIAALVLHEAVILGFVHREQ